MCAVMLRLLTAVEAGASKYLSLKWGLGGGLSLWAFPHPAFQAEIRGIICLGEQAPGAAEVINGVC